MTSWILVERTTKPRAAPEPGEAAPAAPAGAGRSGGRRLRTGAAQRLDLYEDPAHLGVGSGDAFLDAVHGGVDSLRGQAGRELHLYVQQHVVWAEVHREDDTEADHRRVGQRDLANGGHELRVGRLADQQALTLVGEPAGGADEDEADHHRGEAVDERLLQLVTNEHAEERDAQAQQRR